MPATQTGRQQLVPCATPASSWKPRSQKGALPRMRTSGGLAPLGLMPDTVMLRVCRRAHPDACVRGFTKLGKSLTHQELE